VNGGAQRRSYTAYRLAFVGSNIRLASPALNDAAPPRVCPRGSSRAQARSDAVARGARRRAAPEDARLCARTRAHGARHRATRKPHGCAHVRAHTERDTVPPRKPHGCAHACANTGATPRRPGRRDDARRHNMCHIQTIVDTFPIHPYAHGRLGLANARYTAPAPAGAIVPRYTSQSACGERPPAPVLNVHVSCCKFSAERQVRQSLRWLWRELTRYSIGGR